MQIIYRSCSSNTVIANPNLNIIYLEFGNILKIFSNNNRISDPTTWGSYSSGYIANREWYLHTGAVLIINGWVWD